MEFVVKREGKVLLGPCSQAEAQWFVMNSPGGGGGCTITQYVEDEIKDQVEDA